jgi:alpha-tubulin suppressor-like RCC1 family protein
VVNRVSVAKRDVVATGARGYSPRGQRGETRRGRALLIGLLGLSMLLGAFVPAPSVIGAAPPGLVLAWGDNRTKQLGSGEQGVERATPGPVTGTTGSLIALAAGRYHSLALAEDGQVISWGGNFPYGQLGRGSQADRLDPGPVVGLNGVTAIAAFGYNNLAVTGGNVFRWGADGLIESRAPVQVPDLVGTVGVGAGYTHSLAVLTDGTVRAWGLNGYGQLGDGTADSRATPVPVVGAGGQGTLGGIIAVAGGEAHSLALAADGTVYAWGANAHGQLGFGAADSGGHPVPSAVPGLGGITAIAAGYRHSLALGGDGTVWAWGSNADGELGNGSVTTAGPCACSATPARVLDLAGAKAVAAGEGHNLVLREDGTVAAFGGNGSAQLGLTTPERLPRATTVPGLTDVVAIGAGGAHSLALQGRTVPTYELEVAAIGPGAVELAPGGGRYPEGTQVALTATPAGASGAVFVGWTVNDQPAGHAPTLQLTVDRAYSIVARFVVPPAFCDVDPNDFYFEAVRQLAARGIIRGFTVDDGRLCFAPAEDTKRAQMAALIARPLGWDLEDHGNPFSDRGTIDPDLWRNVGTLAHYDVARGYKPETCRALGLATPCYGPTDPVLHAQVISFITRGMVAKGYWQMQPDAPSWYPNVPADSGHRQDIATYVHYAGTLPGTKLRVQDWVGYDQPATRGWFAEAEWRALNSYFGLDRVP